MNERNLSSQVSAELTRLAARHQPPWNDASSERTRTMSTWGTVNDYRTGSATREATAAEWRKTADKLNGYDSDAYTGAWADEDGHSVYVSGGPEAEVTDETISALRDEAGTAGDLAMARICDIALQDTDPEEFAALVADLEDWMGDKQKIAAMSPAEARAECVRVILDTRMETARDAETSEES